MYSSDRGHGGASGFFGRTARAIVWLRFLIVPAWIAATFWTMTSLPSLFDADTGELGNLLPPSAESLRVERESLEEFGLPLLSHSLVVASQPGGLSPRQIAAASRYVVAVDERPPRTAAVRAVPLVNAPGLARGRPDTTLAAFLYTDPGLSTVTREATIGHFAEGLARVSGAQSVELTGAIPAGTAQTKLGNDWLPWLELATIVIVVGILVLYFRAVGVPLLGLATVAIAYLCASHALGWLGLHLGISIPQEVNPVIVALLFGTLTDYVVFFVSSYRNRLTRGEDPREAVTGVTAELLPVVLTAGLMIAGATLTLLLSGVRFLTAFGPGMSVAVLIGVAVALTFIPATLAIFGPAILWPRRPQQEEPPEARKTARGRIVGVAANHPVLTAVLCIVLLGAAASGIRDMELGNTVIVGLPQSSSPHVGYEAAARGFGPGIVGPTMVAVEGDGIASRRPQLDDLQGHLEDQPGVSAVLGPGDQRLRGRYGVVFAPSGNAARYLVVFEGDPNGAGAVSDLNRLEQRLPELLGESGLPHAETGVSGDTAIAAELDEDTRGAFMRIAPAAIVVLLLLLWWLLRSRSAPVYLVAVSALVVVAALGLTVYVFQDLLGYGQLTFFVPVAAAILLLALGSDYNVFLISRIWREAERDDLRPAIQTAGTRAGRAITVAGMILAFSFAAVALVPIRSFGELAFAMAIGLLLDTLLARTLLIPALVSLFGRGRASTAMSRRVGTRA
ncbi:MAG TPA: MMPL family transporter [Solirubrobacterales bacterium]|nr:MMPL family transporter [Solirubrobacterales bacterium]